jgi:hypothetical protein
VKQTFTIKEFDDFYEVYAPLLWGFILKSNLSQNESEKILCNTFQKAHSLLCAGNETSTNTLSALLRIAYQEGLPIEIIRTCFSKETGGREKLIIVQPKNGAIKGKKATR